MSNRVHRMRDMAKYTEELDARRKKQWKLNRTRDLNESPLSHKKIIEISDPNVEVLKDKITVLADPLQPKPKPKPKLAPRLVLARRLETRTLTPKDFDLIGTGRPTGKMDSAGHKLTIEYTVRAKERQRLFKALNNETVPFGSVSVQALAHRLEAEIFKVLRDDFRSYKKQINECVDFIIDGQNREPRIAVLMGRMDAREFVFMPQKNSQLNAKIALKMKTREEEENWKLQQMQKKSHK